MPDLPPRSSRETTSTLRSRRLAELRASGEQHRRESRAIREATAVLLADARAQLSALEHIYTSSSFTWLQAMNPPSGERGGVR
jgi:hypothetical protein